MKSNQRTLLLIGLLVLLGLGTWWLTRRAERSGSTIDTPATAFSVTDTATVDKIFVASQSGEKHTLQRVARNYWRLDDRYTARPDMVSMLLETVARVRIKGPVPKAGRNTVIRTLATNALKVEIYQQGKLVNTFYVGGATNDQLGTYMIQDGSEEPFITHIPGFNGYLTTRYLLKPREWRVNPVFTTPLANLTSIEVLAPGKPDQTFTVRRDGAKLGVDGLPQADSLLVKSYAAQYRNINGQSFIDSTQRLMLDSLLRRPPHYIITVRGKGQTERIRLWQPKGNPDNLAGITDRDSTEVMSVQTYTFKNLLVKRTDFLRKAQ